MARKIIDLTQEISERTSNFPVYPQVRILPWERRDVWGFEAEVLFAPTHVATHIDAPYHFLAHGKKAHELPLEKFILPARVLGPLSGRGKIISLEELREKEGWEEIEEGMAVLLYTGFGERRGDPSYLSEFPGLSPEAAEALAERKINVVGIDAPSIDPPDSRDFPAHKIFLARDILIIENLCELGRLLGAKFELIALPLKIEGASGSPARVLALLE